MAYADNVLNGIIQLNNKNLADIEVSDLLQSANLLRALSAITASTGGLLHSYLKETTAAGAGFRAIGAGISNAAPETTQVDVNLKLLDGSFYRDVALAQGYSKGIDAYMALEAAKALRAAFFQAEKQVIYGSANDASGFSGLAQVLTKSDDDMVVDAAGTSAGTIKTSVWLLRSSPDRVATILGNDGNIQIGEVFQTRIVDGSSNPYTALGCNITGYMGLQVGSIYSVARICNVTDESGKKLTDDMIAEAISKFPAAEAPNMIVMNRTALAQLRDSRTATTPTGAPAPFPAEAFNIPIIVTDAISNAESLLTT